MESKNNNERNSRKDEDSKVELQLPGFHLSEAGKGLLGQDSRRILQTSCGLDQLNSRQKQVLSELVKFTCQHCGNTEEDVGTLQAHRLIRANKGGKYTPNNIEMFCDGCHKRIHAGEFK